jgi:hypothetical protein
MVFSAVAEKRRIVKHFGGGVGAFRQPENEKQQYVRPIFTFAKKIYRY